MYSLILGSSIALAEILYLTKWRAPGLRQNRWQDKISVACTGLVLIGSTTIGLIKWWDFTLAGLTAPTDFTQDYLAALALRDGARVYGPSIQARSLDLFNFVVIENFHPPSNAILFVPFSYLPFSQAFVMWNLLSLAAYVGLIVLLLRSYQLATFWGIHLSALLLLWEPFTASIGLGQISVILALLIVAGFVLLRDRWDRLAGGVFAVATLIKLFPGLLLLYLVVSRRWRCATSFLFSGLIGVLAIYLIAGSDNVYFYINDIIPKHIDQFASFPLNLSIEGIVRTILEPNQYSMPLLSKSNSVKIVVSLINGFLFLLLTVFGQRYGNIDHADDLFALFCVSMLLASPITWAHSCLIILLPLVILTREGFENSQPALIRIVAIVLVLFAIPHRAWTDYLIAIYSPHPAPWYVMLCTKTGSLALIILGLTFLRRLSQRAANGVNAVTCTQ